MKKISKKLIIGFVMLLISVVLITSSSAAFNVEMLISKKTGVKVGDEVIVTVKTSENTQACDFTIKYDKKTFEYVSSETLGLSIEPNGESLKCIYFSGFDTDGITEFKIKFKAIEENDTNVTFSMIESTFKTKGSDSSYGTDEKKTAIQGVSTEAKASSDDNINRVPQPILIGDDDDDGDGDNDNDNTINPISEIIAGNNTTNKTTNNTSKKNNTSSQNNTNTKTNTSVNTVPPVTSETNTTAGISSGGDSSSDLPSTGLKEDIGYIMLAVSVLIILSGIFRVKERELEKDLKSGGIL